MAKKKEVNELDELYQKFKGMSPEELTGREEELKNQVEEYERQIQEIEGQIEVKQKPIDRIQSKINEEIDDDKKAKLTEQLKGFENEKKELEDKKKELEEKKGKEQKEFKCVKSFQKNKDKLERLSGYKTILEEKLRERKKRRGTVKREITKIKKERKQINKRKEQLRKLLKEEWTQEVAEELRALDSRLDVIMPRKRAYEKELKELEMRIAGLETSISKCSLVHNGLMMGKSWDEIHLKALELNGKLTAKPVEKAEEEKTTVMKPIEKEPEKSKEGEEEKTTETEPVTGETVETKEGEPEKVYNPHRVIVPQTEEPVKAEYEELEPAGDKAYKAEYGELEPAGNKVYKAEYGELEPAGNKVYKAEYEELEPAEDKVYKAEYEELEPVGDEVYKAEYEQLNPEEAKAVGFTKFSDRLRAINEEARNLKEKSLVEVDEFAKKHPRLAKIRDLFVKVASTIKVRFGAKEKISEPDESGIHIETGEHNMEWKDLKTPEELTGQKSATNIMPEKEEPGIQKNDEPAKQEESATNVMPEKEEPGIQKNDEPAKQEESTTLQSQRDAFVDRIRQMIEPEFKEKVRSKKEEEYIEKHKSVKEETTKVSNPEKDNEQER